MRRDLWYTVTSITNARATSAAAGRAASRIAFAANAATVASTSGRRIPAVPGGSLSTASDSVDVSTAAEPGVTATEPDVGASASNFSAPDLSAPVIGRRPAPMVYPRWGLPHGRGWRGHVRQLLPDAGRVPRIV